VEKLYEDGVFLELSEVPFADIIALCWRQEAESDKMIIELVMCSKKLEASQVPGKIVWVVKS